MKSLILIEGKESFQFDNIDELVKHLFGSVYLTLSEKEKFVERYERAFPVSKFNNDIPIVHTQMGVIGEKYTIKSDNYELDESLLIDDERTYILSMCKLDKFVLLEEIDSNIFISKIDKSKIENNYVIINSIASELLKREYEVQND